MTEYNFIFAAIYGTKQSQHLVDICCECVETPRIFEWNLFHHKRWLSECCMDIDGVLCCDPSDEQNDDGEKYINFLLSAKPKFIPSVKVKTLISCRLEKYRTQTMFWLSKYGIEYENLILLNLPSKEARKQWHQYGEYKATEYSKPEYQLFIESSVNEAATIHRITHKPVFCVDTMSML